MASHLPPGAFVGIGLGTLFVLLPLLWLLLGLCCLRRRQSSPPPPFLYEFGSSEAASNISFPPGFRLNYTYAGQPSGGQTVNPKDVWKPTDLERFASPAAGMLQPPVILQEPQKCMTPMGESSTHHETEISVLGSSPEATTEGIFLSYSLL
jgi:hypothetical protein